MNSREIAKYNELINLISPYSEDAEKEEKESILSKVNEISEFELELSDLDNYWKSYSIEDFCKELAAEMIKVGVLSEEDILDALKSILDVQEDIDEFDYYFAKYHEAIEFHFHKSTGTLIDVLDKDENDTFNKVVSALRKNDAICL